MPLTDPRSAKELEDARIQNYLAQLESKRDVRKVSSSTLKVGVAEPASPPPPACRCPLFCLIAEAVNCSISRNLMPR
jgi:hypothetical protein